jgi:hypothetical protein
MAAPLVRGPARLRRYAADMVFLAVLCLLVALSIAMYTKAFTPVVMVELAAGRIGNQLSVHADVNCSADPPYDARAPLPPRRVCVRLIVAPDPHPPGRNGWGVRTVARASG